MSFILALESVLGYILPEQYSFNQCMASYKHGALHTLRENLEEHSHLSC